MDHLVCFLPGTIALRATNGLTEAEARSLHCWNAEKSQQMKLARELTKTCWDMYKVTDTGIAPELVWFRASDESLQSRKDMPRTPLARSSNSEEVWKKDFNIELRLTRILVARTMVSLATIHDIQVVQMVHGSLPSILA
jgi:hypothetical protein